MERTRTTSLLLFSMAFALIMPAALVVQAQTFTVLHNFTGSGDGAFPQAGVTVDAAGNLYGTTAGGGLGTCGNNGVPGCGVVFKMQQRGSSWTFAPVFHFSGYNGFFPEARVVFGPNGALYGTTAGNPGNVFSLRPPAQVCGAVSCSWRITVLHTFTGVNGGAYPLGDLVFDSAGNIYGTTFAGGAGGGTGGGTVYEISNGVLSTLYAFGEPFDADGPQGGVTFDSAGNLWGTTLDGGEDDCGTIFELTYHQSEGWVENLVRQFGQYETDGCHPVSNVVFRNSGDFYSTVSQGGDYTYGGGLVANGSVYSFQGNLGTFGPVAGLSSDSAGNLYGTTYSGGNSSNGTVFEYSAAGTITVLHEFSGSDGQYPMSTVSVGPDGKLYGTTSQGGAHGYGVVWQITP